MSKDDLVPGDLESSKAKLAIPGTGMKL